jgi:hypothetical protein
VPDSPAIGSVVAVAFESVCLARHDELGACLPTFDDVARDGATFATAGRCPAPDADGDGLVDGFGIDAPCPWSVGWRDGMGDRAVAGRFTARRLTR